MKSFSPEITKEVAQSLLYITICSSWKGKCKFADLGHHKENAVKKQKQKGVIYTL